MVVNPTYVCAGGEHSLIFNSRNKSLFSAGACGLGWCRKDPVTEGLFSLRKVQLGVGGRDEHCKLFFSSYYHNLAVGGDSGKLYSWGCGTFIDGGLDGVIPALGQGYKSTDVGHPPEVVEFPNISSDPIIQLSGGAYHSIILTKSKEVYTFGANQLGQLGRQSTAVDNSGLSVDPTPALVTGIPTKETVKRIGSGFYNTLVACQSGTLFCAGENQNQQCGSGVKNLREMTIVKEVKNVESAQAGYCHTLVKTIGGQVFSLGCGEEGQRGLGKPHSDNDDNDDDDDEDLILPVVSEVELPTGLVAKQIAAGANHSIILGENGVAYTFGANDVGQCGVQSHDGSESIWSPQAVDIPGKVVEVSAGYAHTLLTTSTGRVFSFGQNDNGQLGIGTNREDCEPSMLPTEVNLQE
mmetsp:Transcript_27421/g.29603  ORF Transcript_27421/g.29603 Transcript_27421/m.29603 type:complete len:409 (+) Transcript_27421:69-1295(+)